MEILDIKLSAFRASWRGRLVHTILSRHKLAVELFMTEIRDAVLEDIPGLIPEGRYKTAELCHPDLWRRFATPGIRRCAGIVLAYWVETGVIPLEFATKPGVYPRRYRLP